MRPIKWLVGSSVVKRLECPEIQENEGDGVRYMLLKNTFFVYYRLRKFCFTNALIYDVIIPQRRVSITTRSMCLANGR